MSRRSWTRASLCRVEWPERVDIPGVAGLLGLDARPSRSALAARLAELGGLRVPVRGETVLFLTDLAWTASGYMHFPGAYEPPSGEHEPPLWDTAEILDGAVGRPMARIDLPTALLCATDLGLLDRPLRDIVASMDFFSQGQELSALGWRMLEAGASKIVMALARLMEERGDIRIAGSRG